MTVIAIDHVKKSCATSSAPANRRSRFGWSPSWSRKGEQIALVGPSGCENNASQLHLGDSSTHLGSILSPENESINCRWGVWTVFAAAISVSFYQDFNLINALTAVENVMLGLRFSRSLARSQWRAPAHVRCSIASGLDTADTPSRRIFPLANDSEWPSPGPSMISSSAHPGRRTDG